MSLLPSSQDEPAIQDALVGIIVKLILGALASAGLTLADNVTAAIAVLVGAIVAAVIGYIQGKVTRGKVFSPATVAVKAPEVIGWPTDVQLPPELTA